MATSPASAEPLEAIVSRIPNDELAFEEFQRRFQRQVRGVLRSGGVADQDLDDCEQEVWLRICRHPPRWDPEKGAAGIQAYVRRVAQNVAADYRRGRNHAPAAAEDLLSRLETNGGQGIPLHKLLVALLSVVFDVTLERISMFGAKPLSELGGVLQAELSKAGAGYKPAHFKWVFGELAKAQGKKRLEKFKEGAKKPGVDVRILKKWVDSACRAAAGLRWHPDAGPIPGIEEVPASSRAEPPVPVRIIVAGIRRSAAVVATPYEKLAYILNKWLQIKEQEIENRWGALGLNKVLCETVKLCECFGIDKAEWTTVFQPLEAQIHAAKLEERTFSSFRGKFTHWVEIVDGHFMNGVLDAEELFLKTVFASTKRPHTPLAFFYLEILKRMPEFDKSLKDLATQAQYLYLPMTDLPPKRVAACFSSFCKNGVDLSRPICDRPVSAGGWEERIRAWRGEVVHNLLKNGNHTDDEALIYAYVCGYLFGARKKKIKRTMEKAK